ncbi:MAG: radical SAM protein, partial [Alphaproteobacteria bacterium]|nr:radical SAM protein [Alphaproteobacteria bacterium]
GVIMMLEENFGSNKKQAYEVARLMKKHDIDWSAPNARCTSVTYEDLKFYKEHNMFSIKFGIESGSQKILDIMEKKFTTKDVYNAISNCKKLGIGNNPSGMVIGMPGETKETVIKSAQFAASLRFLLGMDWNVATTHLAMAIPGTPLYEYCQQIGVIGKTLDEEENYLIRTSNTGGNRSILNYVNKTNSSIKEVHYWIYLFHYAAKKEYVNLIIKNNKPIKHKLLQIYKQCIKSVFNNVVSEFNKRKHHYKNKKLLQKIKWYTFISSNFLMSLNTLFLPKAVLFSIIKMYANMRFYYLYKIYKAKKGKQKYNFFSGQTIESASDFRFTDDKVAKTNRQIDRSLRNVVMENRGQMKPVITDEEIGLQILAKGQ